jgi:hypothetical protein
MQHYECHRDTPLSHHSPLSTTPSSAIIIIITLNLTISKKCNSKQHQQQEKMAWIG